MRPDFLNFRLLQSLQTAPLDHLCLWYLLLQFHHSPQ